MTASSESMFTPLEGAQALLLSKGLYKSAPIHTYAGKLYAQAKGGFIRLLAQNLTSLSGTSWKAVEGAPFIELHDGLHLVEPGEKTKLKAVK